MNEMTAWALWTLWGVTVLVLLLVAIRSSWWPPKLAKRRGMESEVHPMTTGQSRKLEFWLFAALMVVSSVAWILLAERNEARDELDACRNSLDHAHIEYETHMHDEHGAYQ